MRFYRLRICDLCFTSCSLFGCGLRVGSLIRRSILSWLYISGMHYVSIKVTGKDYPINIFSNTFIICLLHSYSRLDNMARFHLPGDPYFPCQGNGGWLEDEQEEDNLVVLVEDVTTRYFRSLKIEPCNLFVK